MQRTCVFTGLASATLQLLLFSPPTSLPGKTEATSRGALPGQHLSCNTGYDLDECLSEIAAVKADLTHLPTERLGEWNWTLVRSQDWKTISVKLERDPGSPAFSWLEQRQTFLEEALFHDVPGRTEDLVGRFQMSRERLRQFAVAHEFAHGMCADKNETKANYLAWRLLGHKPVSCLGKIR